MIRKRNFSIAHDNPILARVRQYYDTQKSDPYIIYLLNQGNTTKQVTIFDAQNNIPKAGFGLPSGTAVNVDYEYTTAYAAQSDFDTTSQTFNAGVGLAIFTGPQFYVYTIAGLTLDEAAQVIMTETENAGTIPIFRDISVVINQIGTTNELQIKIATNQSDLTQVKFTSTSAQNLTRSDTAFLAYGGARSTYQEVLQQISVRPMSMEGNFFESSNPSVIQTNDIIVGRDDVTGQTIQTFLSANLDPYMDVSRRTLPNFNLLDGQTKLTLTLGANSETTLFLFANAEMDKSEQLNHNVSPENMDEDEVDEPAKPFEDYELPKGGFSFW